ncbi:MAG TPA: TetR family transcriptional regulator [Ktedonobacterales bacterium]|nr:TetR family transcriptional regulator [Ktedonobacterales bacterium]
MTALSDGNQPAQGLRERKKAKTRAAIQRHALRLFRKQGYEATTVEQIAAAADVSPSTFFRYFPTKEDVVLYDPFDPVLLAAFEAQPAELTPLQAMREAMYATITAMSAEDAAELWQRGMLILSAPDLRMRMLNDLMVTTQDLAKMVAARVGRRADEAPVRMFVGAVTGALLATFLASANDPNADLRALVDECLEYLDAGMPL